MPWQNVLVGYVIWIVVFAQFGTAKIGQGLTAFGWYSFACAVLLPVFPLRLWALLMGAPGNGWDRYAAMAAGVAWVFFMIAAVSDKAVVTPTDFLKWSLPALFYAGGLAGLLSVLAFAAGPPAPPEPKRRQPYSQPDTAEDDRFDFDPDRWDEPAEPEPEPSQTRRKPPREVKQLPGISPRQLPDYSKRPK